MGMQGLICLSDGMTLGHVVQSYDGQASITFTACRKALPDPEFYSECIQRSFGEMIAAATLPPTVTRRTAARSKSCLPKTNRKSQS